ncbi:hypothetical protein [Burkholderia phage BCSR5]|nr:hypothetical protein [Burkholderia phage BCSR5]
MVISNAYVLPDDVRYATRTGETLVIHYQSDGKYKTAPYSTYTKEVNRLIDKAKADLYPPKEKRDMFGFTKAELRILSFGLKWGQRPRGYTPLMYANDLGITDFYLDLVNRRFTELSAPFFARQRPISRVGRVLLFGEFFSGYTFHDYYLLP